ncbi:MAG: FeoB-associated Cys-rich membrane protein [Massiliimalia sp.]|jgi:hypothetical protein
MTYSDWIVILLLLLAVVFVLASMVRQRKKGECAGGCSGCPHSKSCGLNEERKEEESL